MILARPHLVHVLDDSLRDPAAFFGMPLRKVPPAHIWRWRASLEAVRRIRG